MEWGRRRRKGKGEKEEEGKREEEMIEKKRYEAYNIIGLTEEKVASIADLNGLERHQLTSEILPLFLLALSTVGLLPMRAILLQQDQPKTLTRVLLLLLLIGVWEDLC